MRTGVLARLTLVAPGHLGSGSSPAPSTGMASLEPAPEETALVVTASPPRLLGSSGSASVANGEATREPAFAEADATPGTYRFVRVFETHHVAASAPPVLRDLFTGSRDEFRAYNPTNGCLELLS